MATKRAKDKLFTKSYIAIMISNFMQMFAFWLIMPLLPFYLEENFACSESKIGFVLSLFTVSALIFRPFSGYLLDTFRRKPLYIMALFLFMSMFSGYIICSSLTMFIILRLSHGISFGAQSVGGNTLVVDIMPSSRRGEGLGYYGLTNNIAMSIGPMFGLLMKGNFSYEFIFTICVAICLIGFVSANMIKTKGKSDDKRETCERPFQTQMENNNAYDTEKATTKFHLIKLDRFVLFNGIPASISLLLLSIPYGATTNFVAMYVRQMHMDVEAGLYFTFMAIGMGVSRLFAGKMVDRGYITRTICYGLYLIIIAFALLSSCEHIMPLNKNIASIVFFTVPILQGVGFGILFPAYNSLYIALAPHNRRATATSTYLTAWDAGIGIGIASSGIIAQNTSFGTVFFVGAILCIISTLFFIKKVIPHFIKHRIEETRF